MHAHCTRRFMHKPFVTSKQVAGDICSGLVPVALAAAAAAEAAADATDVATRMPRAGLMFGRESSGLTNEEVALANKVCMRGPHTHGHKKHVQSCCRRYAAPPLRQP